MDESRSTIAIILNSRPYRENDSLINIYTLEFGKLSLVARGTKKLASKMAGHLEPLSLVKLMIIKGKGFDYIGGALAQDCRLGIREDLNKIYYAGRIIAFFSSLVKDNEKDERLFSLLEKYLELIDLEPVFDKETGILFFLRFSLSFLSELGYKPEMYNCLHCGQKLQNGSNYFDLKNGGVICLVCGEELKKNASGVADKFKDGGMTNILTISDNCVKIIRYFISNDNRQPIRLSKRVIKEASDLVKKFILFVK